MERRVHAANMTRTARRAPAMRGSSATSPHAAAEPAMRPGEAMMRSAELRIRDVREQMPRDGDAVSFARRGTVTGVAVHHSATANHVTGVSMEDAATIFRHHVERMAGRGAATTT